MALDRRNRGVFSCGNSALPAGLKPFNQLWLKIGLLLHKMVNPIMMALVFFGAVMPTGLIMRALRKACCGKNGSPTPIVTGSNGGRPRKGVQQQSSGHYVIELHRSLIPADLSADAECGEAGALDCHCFRACPPRPEPVACPRRFPSA